MGRAIAHLFADEGSKVAVTDRDGAGAARVATEITDVGRTATAYVLDVADVDAVEAVVSQVAVELGQVDVLVNNAGVSGGAGLKALTVDEWDYIMDINLKGAWLVARAAANMMIEQNRGGSIINISSILGVMSQKGAGVYCASKAGLTHLTRTMALEWARYGIRVNAIEPGYYPTDMSVGFTEHEKGLAMVKAIPMRRLGKPEEMDGAILLLASNAGSYMTGTAITIDGGQSFPVVV
jgi:2-deoxy-D-gluconate 3-dehydrogenase